MVLNKEKELIGHGVAYCAACDGMFYKDKIVVVVGGGNSAVSDATLLSRIAKKVIIVHRRDTLRATKIYNDQLMKTENIEFRWNSTVKETALWRTIDWCAVERYSYRRRKHYRM